MSDECPRQNCFVPSTGCALGHVKLSNCPAWEGSAISDAEETPSSDETLLPWTGDAMGLVDLGFVAGRGKPIVVGIVGPHNAGKTTLLAAWYLLLGRGTRLNSNWRIAGSYTLQGWGNGCRRHALGTRSTTCVSCSHHSIRSWPRVASLGFPEGRWHFAGLSSDRCSRRMVPPLGS